MKKRKNNKIPKYFFPINTSAQARKALARAYLARNAKHGNKK